MKTELKQKLTSRKFWLGVALVVLGTVLCITGDTETGMVLISTGGLGYLGCEMLVDLFRIVFSCSFFNEQVEQERAEAAAENSCNAIDSASPAPTSAEEAAGDA